MSLHCVTREPSGWSPTPAIRHRNHQCRQYGPVRWNRRGWNRWTGSRPLDYVQKVSFRNQCARMFTGLRPAEPGCWTATASGRWKRRRWDEASCRASLWPVQDVVANNAAIISLDWGYTQQWLKMNDSERMEQLDGYLQGSPPPGGFTGHHQTDHVRRVPIQTEFGACNGIGIWHQ